MMQELIVRSTAPAVGVQGLRGLIGEATVLGRLRRVDRKKRSERRKIWLMTRTT